MEVADIKIEIAQCQGMLHEASMKLRMLIALIKEKKMDVSLASAHTDNIVADIRKYSDRQDKLLKMLGWILQQEADNEALDEVD